MFIDTNFEGAFIYALQNVMFSTKHTVCLWYIDKNIFTNCKLLFDLEKKLTKILQ